MLTCPNGHGDLIQNGNGWKCPVCVYTMAARIPEKERKIDKHLQTVNQEIRNMLVDARINDELVPWKRPWIILPKRNYDSGVCYRGINRWLLSFDPEIFYITPDSIKKKELKEPEGAIASIVVAFVPPKLSEKEKKTLPKIEQENLLRKRYPRMFSHCVYMARDVEGLPEKKLEEEKDNKRFKTIESFIKNVKKKGILIEEGGNRAQYFWDRDVITIPKISQFNSSEDYYRSLLHQVAHASGHESRLKRDEKKFKRYEEFGKEELVAEFASAYMAHYFGIPVEQNTTASIDGWLRALDGDSNLLVSAAQRAEAVLKFFDLN